MSSDSVNRWEGLSWLPYAKNKQKCWAIKNGNANYVAAVDEFLEHILYGFVFGTPWDRESAICVIPRSGHGEPARGLIHTTRPMGDIADQLVEYEYVSEHLNILKRIETKEKIPKGNWEAQRDSLFVDTRLLRGVKSLILLDNQITQAGTFAGAAAAIQECFDGKITGLFYCHTHYQTPVHGKPDETNLKMEVVAPVGVRSSWRKTGNW